MSNDKPVQKQESLLSKFFRRKSSVGADAAETASMTSTAPLVDKDNTAPFKSTSKEEQDSFNELMNRAKTMSPEEFQMYLKNYKEENEAIHRKLGGGITGGEWIWRDPKAFGPL
ncbi:hypothetical protein H2204_005089 [Knufia peltigerae]|uniref:Uncharacterized protein n=1 Tax=Knufia peltigerae TaxID=1002370 RepID=A0AA38Y6C9_9EURO|nr:hypothetical protein H2204_005089 [Knufia peltigerae]